MTEETTALGWFDAQTIDPKVPTWDGTGGAIGLEMYLRISKGYLLGQKSEEQYLHVNRLWLNLRKEAARACKDNTGDLGRR